MKKFNNILPKIKDKIHKQKSYLNNLKESKSIDKLIEKIKHKSSNLGTPKILLAKINPIDWIENSQEKLIKIFQNESNQEVVLKQSTFWTSAITWVLIGGTAFSLGWVSIAKTEEIVISLGKLEPKGGVIDVQMPLEGVAREILIKEGDRVKKGQLLIRLDTDATKAQNIALQNNLELNNQIIKKYSFLLKEGAVSEVQYLQQKAKSEDLKSQIKVNQVKLKYQEIISPADGMVFDMAPKGPGFVARSSEPVLKIVPFNNLIAKVEIDNRSIGFVKPGKKVEISIDSFPASDFGVIEGEVLSISSDALPPKPQEGLGYRFPAKIRLNEQYLELKSGAKLPLQAGMSLTANIKLRKVTYLQLLLNKFSDKANSLKSI